MRTGIGYDSHRLQIGRPLVLGGVTIPSKRGLLGHSDADVLLHAIMDALLGAAGLGDLGIHFPDNDNRYLGISSLKLLQQVRQFINESGFKIINIDCILVAEEPKIASYRQQILNNIADTLSISVNNVNIKATTNERMGFVGRGEGIASLATVLIDEIE